MGCPTVDKFLCCVNLETGGLILGYLTIIVSVIGISGLAIAITFSGVSLAAMPDDSLYFLILVGIIVICSVYIAYFIVFLTAGVLLIQGTRKRDPSLLILMMIIMVIGKVIAFLQIIATGYNGISYGIIFAMVNFYLFVCVRSLYQKFQREKSLEGIVHYYNRPPSMISAQPVYII